MHIAVGSRVVVPFGTQRLEGYCTGLSAEMGSETSPVEIRTIEKLLDEEPLLTAELVSLAAWGAKRYLCRRIDFFKAMTPAGARWSSRKWVHYTGSKTEHDPALVFLQGKGCMLLSPWVAAFPEIKQGGLLHRLEQKGIITLNRRDLFGVKKQSTRMVFLHEKNLQDEGAPDKITGRKQLLALELLREQGELPSARLRAAGVSDATVQTLVRRGLIGIRSVETLRNPLEGEAPLPLSLPLLTDAQADALRVIRHSLDGQGPRRILLHGVTGSGKTEVYLQAIAGALKSGRGSIVLVPEIALTAQMIERFTERFGEQVAVLHSRLSAGERYDEWRRIAGGEAMVVIGARSAIFAPFRDLGLVILDEEHEHTYKQEELPRYHVRDVAMWRADWHNGTVILGSATPSLESYLAAEKGEYTLCSLPERVEKRSLPHVQVVDMRKELKDGHRSIFSRPLLAAMRETFSEGRQAILFLNRRGFATFILCRECGHVMRCPACRVTLKFHTVEEKICCHYCKHSEKYPLTCPACGGRYIRHFGTGTQKVAEELSRFFPEAHPERLDADSTARKGAHKQILARFRRGDANVLIGTQMVAKGLDFPNVTLVGVITADTALNLPDFRAGERTFQLLTQVAGRAGRSDAGGKVIVQTYAPDHYAVVAAKTHDYINFYYQEIKLREELGYPPFSRMVKVLFSGSEENNVMESADEVARLLENRVELLGPSPCPISKMRGNYRWQLVVRGLELEPLLAAVQNAATVCRGTLQSSLVRLTIDVDPQNLL
jgi:primosomal protein N' (replication factor Y)